MSVIGGWQTFRVMLNEYQSQLMLHMQTEVVRQQKTSISRERRFAERRMHQTDSGLRDHRDSVRE